MRSQFVASIFRTGLSAVAALFVSLLCLGQTALGQSTGGSSAADTQSTSDTEKYLNNSLYKIIVVARYRDRDTAFSSTGVLVKAPNLILTTAAYDEDGTNVYSNSRTNLFGVCEQELDLVQQDAKLRKLKEEEAKDKAEEAVVKKIREESAQIAQKSTKGNSEKATAKKGKEQEDADRQRVNSILDFKANCVLATVRKVDSLRGLVLLEATERLEGGVPVFNVRNPDGNMTVRAFGFPSAAEDLPTRRSTERERNRMKYVPTVTTGTIAKVDTDAKDGQRIIHQAPVSGGAFGGPIVNNCNEVVGLNVRQRMERVVVAQGKETRTANDTVQVKVATTIVPTTYLVNALGAKELLDFAALNDIDIKSVRDGACTATLAGPTNLLQQNLLPLAIGGIALLLATAAMVIAVRRPGPVRNTVAHYFPSMREQGTFQPGYSDYGGPITSETPNYMPYGSASAPPIETLPATSPAPHAAEPTSMMPGAAPTVGLGGATLTPIGSGAGGAVMLDAGRLDAHGVLVGREPDCDIVIDNSTVSKRHARITRTSNGKLQIEDLGSANGTWRGRRRIQTEAFGNGDTVRFGSLEYRVELASGVTDRSGPTLMMSPVRSWMLSGFDEEGRVVQWKLQPTLDGSGHEIETSWIIGRNSERADKVLSDKRISGEHAKIRFTPQRGLEICDLGSSNGTKVDGNKVSDSYLAIDDARVIEFGGSRMTLSKA